MINLSGAFIAPATPVTTDGSVDYPQFERLLDFLIESGIDGVCIGGGTAEYPRFDSTDRGQLISVASNVLGKRGKLLASIGSSSYSRTLALGRQAEKISPDALLLPAPHFFRYQQNDLEHFCRSVSRKLSVPIILYNLPVFTNPYEVDTALRLLQSEPNIIGIKDSSGDRKALPAYRDGRQGHSFSLLMGMDTLIFDALETGWDGSISGLGNLCPDLIAALVSSYRKGDIEKARHCQDLICRIATEFGKLPVPWAVRAGLEVRGYPCGPTAIPPCPERTDQIKEFQAWFEVLLDSELKGAVSTPSI
jgi:4-hydroxy-tetrahydrodipicolinate synthase